MSVRIRCINKPNRDSPVEAISHLGWINEQTNTSGRSTREAMYEFIKDDGGTAYVVDPKDDSKVYLTTAISANGTKYVKTKPNDTGRDNLLSLPEC